jgi:teichoic acid transport system permease protein
LLESNPIHIFLKIARSILVSGYSATLTDWIIAASWAVGTMLVGFIFFWRAEEKYGRIV